MAVSEASIRCAEYITKQSSISCAKDTDLHRELRDSCCELPVRRQTTFSIFIIVSVVLVLFSMEIASLRFNNGSGEIAQIKNHLPQWYDLSNFEAQIFVLALTHWLFDKLVVC